MLLAVIKGRERDIADTYLLGWAKNKQKLSDVKIYFCNILYIFSFLSFFGC